jgi:hypothetical protein
MKLTATLAVTAGLVIARPESAQTLRTRSTS